MDGKLDLIALLFVLLFGAAVLFLGKAYVRGRAIRLREESRAAARASRQAQQSVSSTGAVFLSYRREDAIDITGRLYDRLTREVGHDAVFKDIDSIPLGSDFRKHIDESLRNCKIFLLIVGKNWLGDLNGVRRIDDRRDYIRLEVETALLRNIPVIPILVHGALIPNENELPEGMSGIAYRQAIVLRPDPDFHRDADRIVSFVKSQLR